MMRVAWVTGASSGLGLYTVQALTASGWRVVGGARGFADGQEGSLHKLPLDVREDSSVAAFCQVAQGLYGPPHALVNAAGVLMLGACEDLSPQEAWAVMDTNFLGALRMTRQVLPMMRGQGGGRVVNFSSVNGLLATPFQGAYTASKHALEGYSEALAMEVRPHGIQVMLVEPGDHRGGQMKYRTSTQGSTACYQQARDKAIARIHRDEATGGVPARLGRKVARAMNRRRMPLRLRVTQPPETLAIVLHDLLPSNLFTRLLSMYYCGRGKIRNSEFGIRN